MEIWGVGSFENDDAMAWVDELEHSDDFNAITEALAFVANLDLDEQLEMREAAACIAAAEVVAALHGHPAADLPPEVQDWIAGHQSLSTHDPVPLALRAVERVRSDSDLREEWLKSSGGTAWEATVGDLVERLRQSHQG